jgi:hypothetical protein
VKVTIPKEDFDNFLWIKLFFILPSAVKRGAVFIHRWTNGQMDNKRVFIAKMSTNPYLRLFRLGAPRRRAAPQYKVRGR